MRTGFRGIVLALATIAVATPASAAEKGADHPLIGRFEVLFECSNDACGGLAFANAVIPNSGAFMWSDDDDQRYIAARKSRPEKGNVHAAIYVTRNSSGGPDKGKIMTAVHVVEAKPRETRVVVVKADSRPTLEQIGKLLRDNPDLELVAR